MAGPTHDQSVMIEESYKRPIVIADSVAGGLFGVALLMAVPCLGSLYSDSESGGDEGACGLMAITALGGMGTFVAASPLIHLAKGNGESAAMSFALRLGLPAAGIMLADKGDGELGSLAFIGGVAAAMVVDWTVLAKRERPMSQMFVPTVVPTRGGAQLGLSGSF